MGVQQLFETNKTLTMFFLKKTFLIILCVQLMCVKLSKCNFFEVKDESCVLGVFTNLHLCI